MPHILLKNAALTLVTGVVGSMANGFAIFKGGVPGVNTGVNTRWPLFKRGGGKKMVDVWAYYNQADEVELFLNGYSLGIKKKALEDVTKAEKASSAEKVRIAKVDLDILKSKAAAMGGEAEKKMKGEIREATIALNEAETENAMTGIKLNKQKKMLGRQELSDAKEIADAKKEALKTQQEAEKTALKEREDKAKLSFENEKLLLEAKKKLEENKINTRRYFYPSLNTLPHVKVKFQSCPVSEDISSRVLCLPLYPELEENNVSRITDLIKKK